MSLLSICQALAKNVGLSVPDQIVGSSSREWVEAREFATETGQELARRVDWGVLSASTTLTGNGTNQTFTLPANFARLQRGVTVLHNGEIVRPLTRQEWNTLTPFQGAPRYFLLEGNRITLWPFLANGATATVRYQSKNWLATGDAFTADDQTALIDENLLEMGLIARWRRQKGMPFEDYEAEYEAALRDLAGFDNRARF